MDPALRELLRAEPDKDREIEAIIRLARPGIEIPGVRMVARFGPVVTCRVPLRDVQAVHDRPDVISLKAARTLGPGHAASVPGAGSEIRPSDIRRPAGLTVTGAGAVVGSVDWGADVAAPAFRRPSGATRFLALWDQRDQATGNPPQPYGYGAVHDRTAIDRALLRGRPYKDLGYHPGVADRGGGSHGTHVLDIAAGNARGGGPAGLAPAADLVFAHLADRGTGGLSNLGDSVRLLEAVDFIVRTAGSRPWVINTSLGRHGGPHDGSTLVELAFDELLSTATGLIVQSNGNYARSRIHAAGVLVEDETRSLTFVVDQADLTGNELEIWYDGADEFAVAVTPPGAPPAQLVPLGSQRSIVVDGRTVGQVYHRAHDPNSGDHQVDAFLEPIPGEWTVTLEARRIVHGRFDAWLERDDACPGCQARFTPQDSSMHVTTGTVANGHLPLVVGAYDAHDPTRPPGPFSSAGPTRDGRQRPDLAAPGVAVLATRSTPWTGGPASALVRKSGTSMAAPHVTGAVALCLAMAGGRLDARVVRDVVLSSCDPADAPDPLHRLGHGYLNISRLIETTRRAVHFTPGSRSKEQTMDTADVTVTLVSDPATAYREVLYRPDGDYARRLAAGFEIVARPGDPVGSFPRAGDVLLEVALGRRNAGRCADLDDADAEAVRRRRRLPPGRLVLRRIARIEPGPDPEPDPDPAEDRDVPMTVPTHVRAARDVWTRMYGKDALLSRVVLLDMLRVPSTAVRDAGFAAWTNSSTRIFIAQAATADPLTLESVLRHEAVHVRQFAKAKGHPTTYKVMIEYELAAYCGDRDRLGGLGSSTVVKQLRSNAAKAIAALTAIEARARDGHGSDAEREQDRKAELIDADMLPRHDHLVDLYEPPKAQRNPAAVESVDESVRDGSDAEFDGPEHKLIGDEVFGSDPSNVVYGVPARPLTFGDVVSLAGDYYETYWQMRDAGPRELEWARWDCLHLKKQGVAEPTHDKATRRRVTDRYFLLAAHNLAHFSAGGTGWASYSEWHGKAIVDALEAGQTGSAPIWQRALTKEAFGVHFLTDIFSAGHVRTPRRDIQEWYLQHIPDSSTKILTYLTRHLFQVLRDHHQVPLSGVLSVPVFGSLLALYEQDVTRDRVRAMGGEALKSFTLGDIVSLALHDLDNKRLDVVSDVNTDGRPVRGGFHWTAVGDTNLRRPVGATTKTMVSLAVISSLRDLERVRGVGVRLGGTPVTSPEKADQIRAALGADGFSARRFVPREDLASTLNPALVATGGRRAALDWRWGQFGDAAYAALDRTVKVTLSQQITTMAGDLEKPDPGVREALIAFAQHLERRGIGALEEAVGARAR